MQKHYKLTLNRLKQYKAPLAAKRYPETRPIKLSAYFAPDRITYEEAMKGDYHPFKVGYNFGPLWSTHWVKVEYEIPVEWQGKEVHLLWDSMCEGAVWIDGNPMQGLTGSTPNNPWMVTRPDYELSKSARGGEMGVLYIEVAVNHLFGVGGGGPEIEHVVGWLRQAELAIFDRDAWDLYWDFVVVADMAQELPEGTPRKGQAMRVANTMIDTIRLDDHSTWAPARTIAAEFFAEKNGEGQHNLSAIGNAHIDTAWLWPLAETHRKCYRTFASAVKYMDDYPEYKFTVSQAQQFEWMKYEQPDLYQRIKEKFENGQFIPTGGSWVEMDANLPNGESFVRQFLLGQRYFEKEFGFHCVDFWEPDVFGYSAALPQILKLSEIDYFLTQKLSWNQFNKISTHTFIWEGIDGSQVLTHFPPLDTYGARATVSEAIKNVQMYKDHENSKESYLLFGFGDGGGGPTKDMLEQLRRMKNVDGLPTVEIRSPKEFYQRLDLDLKDPVKWVGELYLEYHRGTYTTQALTKKNNRRSEFMLHDIEFLSAMAGLNGYNYPTEDLDWMWKMVLTNQFHDIIPGSSITEVYDEAAEDYKKVLNRGVELRSDAIKSLLDTKENGENLVVVNTTGFDREEVVELPKGTTSTQISNCGKPLGIVSSPSYGYSIQKTTAEPAKPVTLKTTQDGFIFENQHVVVCINKSGEMLSLFSKEAGREALAPDGIGNKFVLFEDRPCAFDAWDVDIYHLETREEVPSAYSCEVIEEGPFRVAVAFDYKISETSTINQVIRLSATSKHLDFKTRIDWHEEYRVLKVEFPWDVRASEASYEIQFGHLQRPTHFNTSWDFAQFEVCSHKWADLSEYGFGVSLLNDCKYGHSTKDNIMRLTLLRSPKEPDPIADMGTHHFQYAVMPHAGTLQDAGLIAEGYCFNQPLQIAQTDAAPSVKSFFSVDKSAVVIDTVKKAEDSDEIIIRMYESFGAQCNTSLRLDMVASEAMEVNLLEHDINDVTVENGQIELHFGAFQIRTLKLKAK
ncbi:MAG: hypothetical protein K8R40_08165 [Anaerolineaceae bacterium]|nr:hypothetical protein [Anaerolineaceae bacterium]